MTDAKPFTEWELRIVRRLLRRVFGRVTPLSDTEQCRLLATLDAERARREAAEVVCELEDAVNECDGCDADYACDVGEALEKWRAVARPEPVAGEEPTHAH